MSAFEFLAVLLSIVFGLGLTQILSGVSRMIHRRRDNPPDGLHLIWSLNVFLVLVLNWWVTFSWSTIAVWSFEIYVILISWSVTMYLLAVILYPPDLSLYEHGRALYFRNRRWFLGTLLCFLLLDAAQSAVRNALFSPPLYLPFIAHHFIFAGTGLMIRRPAYHWFYAVYFLVSLVAWALVFRRLLV